MLTQADRTRSLLGNTAVLALAQFSGIAVSLAVTPYVLHTLGVELFGLWALVGSIVAYVGLLQLGVGKGTIRFIAFHAERQELDVIRRLVSYGIAWHLAVGIVLCPLAWLIARFLLPYLNISRPLLGTAESLFLLVFAYGFFGSAVRPLAALVIGLDRMWIASLATLGSQLVYGAAVVAMLSHGVGIYALPAGAFLQTALQAATLYFVGRRLIGRVLGNPFALDRSVRNELLRFGGWFQATTVARLINNQTDAILIGTWVNVGSVGLYALGNRLAQLVQIIPLTLLPPLLPSATRIHAQEDERRMARTILQGAKLVGLMTIGLAGFVLSTSPLIMTVWLGHTYPNVAAVTALLVLAFAVNNLTGVGTTVTAAIGKPRYESEYAVLGMVVNILATIALAPFFGLYGILAGTVIGIVLCSVYFLWRFHRLMRLSLWDYVGAWLWRLLAATLIPALTVFSLRSTLPTGVSEGRGKAALVLAAFSVLYVVLLVAGLRLFRCLEARDLAILRRVLPNRLQTATSLRALEFLFGART